MRFRGSLLKWALSVATPAILLAVGGFAPLRANDALPPGAPQAAISESAIPQIAAPQIVAPHIVELGLPAAHAPTASKVSRITRIERFGATSAGLQDPALSSLDRDETVVEPPSADQPGAIFNPANLVDTKPAAKTAGELAGHSLATNPLPLDLDAGSWLDGEIFSKQTVATCWTAAILMTLAYFRRAIFAAINRSVFWAVAMFGGQK
ncbi:MAG: hypothetical protein K8T25_20305, partial [Planctomycetia bacterium]|nr:hypothetical protein [Planctomycetia bacterium]